MLYRYFIGTGETEIQSVEQVYELYKKGMISRTSKLYDVEKNMYVEAYAVPEFIDVFMEDYTGESKASKLLKYIISTVFFLMFLLIGMINAFLKFGLKEVQTNTTNFLLYMIGIFFGMALLIALIIFVCTKFLKKYNSYFIIGSSILLFIVSTALLVNTVIARNAAKPDGKQIEKAALVKVIEMLESKTADKLVDENISDEIYGKYAPFVSETCDYALSLLRINKQVEYMFKSIPLNQIVSPEVLSDAARLKDSRQRIKVIVSGLSESKAEVAPVYDAYISKIENLDIPKSIREQFIIATKKNNEIEKKEKDELFDLNIKLFEKIDEVLKFFEDRPGRYSIANNTIAFSDKSDQDNYIKLTQEYEALLMQYSDAVTKGMENDESNLALLKKLVEANYKD